MLALTEVKNVKFDGLTSELNHAEDFIYHVSEIFILLLSRTDFFDLKISRVTATEMITKIVILEIRNVI